MATDMFLELDGIKGEAQDKKHAGKIDIDAFSFGVHQSGTSGRGGGAGAGKADFQDLSITKKVDKSSPILMLACATGKHIAKATLFVRKAGGKQEEYYKIVMTDLLVSSFQNSGADGANVPMESVSLNYAKIEFEYFPQNADGTMGGKVASGYDLKTNQKV